MRAETVIATHGNTDFDAFAAMLAARRLYPGAAVALGSLNRNVREFYRLHADELQAVDASRLETDAIKRLVVIETVHASRLGELLERVVLDEAVEKVLFDHHGNELPAWVDPSAAVLSHDGALATTLAGILAERELEPTPLEATALALGIHEDTGSLTYATTTQRDADALAWCLRHGARQDVIARYLHLPLSENERELLHHLTEVLEPVATAGEEVLLAAVTWPVYVDGVSNLAHKLIDLTDCRALVLLVEMEDRVFCVTRSRGGALDAGAVAAVLGGGGHVHAASAIARVPLAEARLRVLDALPGAMREPRRARDVMAKPARSIGPNETVQKAMIACQRHGQSGIFVSEGGVLVGAVGREDLDKAIGHGLSHAPVKGVMSSQAVTCSEDTTLAELHGLVAAADDGRVAVVQEGRLTGVVTRSDLLRALEGPAGPVEPPLVSLAGALRKVKRLASVFEAVGALGDRAEAVYLVGGSVRDILLGEPGFDVDIAVEGDAIAFARALAEPLGGRVTIHEKFGTAAVLYGERERVDVVTTRTEFYDAPAALPSVERAAIREDLFRRDFTLNAMALSLKPADFGRLVDPFGGRRDIETRTLRVLHNLSFIDDPTRIFRAIRYETRYGLRLEEHSLQLARSCIELGLVGDLSTSRLRDELIALLDERETRHSILRLGELGADHAIHAHLRADEEAADLLARLVELRAQYAVDVPAWRLGLTVLARALAPDEAYGWLERLKVRRRDAERIAGAVVVAPRVVERLRSERLDPAEVVALCDSYAPDAPLYALALSDLPPLHAYFERLRDVHLEITGADLVGLGLAESPRVGEVLAELRRRKLNGDLDGRDSELAAAQELISQE